MFGLRIVTRKSLDFLKWRAARRMGRGLHARAEIDRLREELKRAVGSLSLAQWARAESQTLLARAVVDGDAATRNAIALEAKLADAMVHNRRSRKRIDALAGAVRYLTLERDSARAYGDDRDARLADLDAELLRLKLELLEALRIRTEPEQP